MAQPIVTSSPDILSGTPVFAGTRVPVQALIDYLSKDNPAGGPYVLRVQSDGSVSFYVWTTVFLGSSAVISPPGLVAAGVFAHVAGTYDAATGELCVYVDGEATCSAAAGTLQANTNTLKLGADLFNHTYFAGLIDEALLFDRALDASDVLVLLNRPSQTITFGSLPTRTFGDPPFSVTATASSGLPVSFGASGECTVAGNTVTLTGAGNCTVTASQLGGCELRSGTGRRADLHDWEGGADDHLRRPAGSDLRGDPPFAVSTTASSGLPVNFSAAGGCSASGNTITIAGAGSCTVTASQAGNANYEPAIPVSQTFAIAKAPQTISFAPLPGRTYGDLPFTLSATASSGLGVTFSAAGQCTVAGATVTLTGAGSCALTASQAGSANYLPAPDVAQTFTIAKSPTSTSVSSNGNPSNAGQTVTFTATVTTSAGLATGSVTFLDGSVVLGTEPLTGGQASLSTGSLAVGMHAITAQYSGDADRLGSTSTVLTQAVLTTGADLVTTSVTNPPATSAPGLAFAVTDTVLNQETGVAGSSVTRYFLSTDGVARTRLLSGSRSVGSLGPSQTSVSVGTSVQVPNGTALGTYYLLACADDTLRVTESNGTNNCRASISRVQVTP